MLVAAANSRDPNQSKGARSPRRGNFSANADSVKAMTASGTLNHSAHRQPGPSVKNPPSKGPSTLDRPKTAPMSPMYLPRSRAGTTSAMIACESTIRPPPPTPCTARARIIIPMDCAFAPISEPSRNTAIANKYSGLRPS